MESRFFKSFIALWGLTEIGIVIPWFSINYKHGTIYIVISEAHSLVLCCFRVTAHCCKFFNSHLSAENETVYQTKNIFSPVWQCARSLLKSRFSYLVFVSTTAKKTAPKTSNRNASICLHGHTMKVNGHPHCPKNFPSILVSSFPLLSREWNEKNKKRRENVCDACEINNVTLTKLLIIEL